MTTDLKTCHCSCGEVKYHIHGKPLLRGFCHCTICQKFNQAPFADITVFRLKDVDMPNAESVNYSIYRAPPAVNRGVCRKCKDPVVEFMNIPLLPKVVIVPTQVIKDKYIVPAPSLHVFYETRIADIQDNLAKYSGYLRSQIAFGRRIFTAL